MTTTRDAIGVLQISPSVRSSHGGPSTGALSLHEHLRAIDESCVLLAGAYEMREGRQLVSSPVQSLGFANAVEYPASRPHRVMNSFRLGCATIRRARRAQLIHMHGQYLAPHVYAYVAARMFRTPYGVQVHGTLEPYQRAHSSRKKWAYDLLVGRRVLRNATYVHFASQSEADGAADVVRPEQSLVVPLGAELSFTPRRPGALEVLLPTRQDVFLYLGRLAQKKRPDVLLRAWAEVPSPRGLLVIAGPDEYFTGAGLMELAQELGVSDSVVVLGSVDADERTWLYEHAGTFVLPSENENFAIVIAEAMMAGCHVITTRYVAAHEHLVRAHSGVVLDEVSSADLTSELVRTREQPDAAAESGARGRAYALENLAWDGLAAAIIGRRRAD